MKILSGDLNVIFGREDVFKPTIGNESLHQDGNENGVRIVNFATPKNLVVKSMIFLHQNIYKYTCTSPDEKRAPVTLNLNGRQTVFMPWLLYP
jgi:hypothetical protein